jgi:uncharacterized protein (TIRG00374 family)
MEAISTDAADVADTADTADVADAAPGAPPRRRPWLTAIKIAVSALLVAWILHRADLRDVGLSWRAADPRFVLLAFALCPLGWIVSVFRWRLLLRALGGEADVRLLLRASLVGIFFNNLLPGTMGGDAVRIYQTARSGLSGARAVTVILVDRFLGLVALLGFAAVALATERGAMTRSSSLPYYVGAGIVVAVLSSSLLFSRSVWISGRIEALLGRLRAVLPAAARGLFDRLFNALFAFRGRYGVLARAFVLSLCVQALVVANAICLARALHIEVPAAYYFFLVPLALFAMMVPVSINGVGVRESVWAFFLVPLGVATATALAFAWLDYGILLAQAVLGGMVYAFSYRSRKAAPPAVALAGKPAGISGAPLP